MPTFAFFWQAGAGEAVVVHSFFQFPPCQRAYLELIAGLKGAYCGASLLPCCADYGDEFLICPVHMRETRFTVGWYW